MNMIRNIKGTKDLLPKDTYAWQNLESYIHHFCQKFGYSEIRTPVFEESIVFDGKATMVTGNNLLKTLCWYDNGWGFSKRILDTIKTYHKDGR